MMGPLLVALALAAPSAASLLPGAAIDYKIGDSVPLLANALSSPATLIPYDHYDPRLAFCSPSKAEPGWSLLALTASDERVLSPEFALRMQKNTTCNVLCTSELSSESTRFLTDRIHEGALHSWYVDGLPMARPRDDGQGLPAAGFELGQADHEAAAPLLYNHYLLVIDVFQTEEGLFRVVGAEAHGQSRAYSLDARGLPDCEAPDLPPLRLTPDAGMAVTYTYDVQWRLSRVPWSSRWDSLRTSGPTPYRPALANPLLIALLLSCSVAALLLVLHREIASQPPSKNAPVAAAEDVKEKRELVQGGALRAPANPLLLSVLVGNGVQVLLATCAVLAAVLLGLPLPSAWWGLVPAALGLHACLGLPAGYTSARLYRALGGEARKACAITAATLVPGLLPPLGALCLFLVAGRFPALPGLLAGSLCLWALLACPLCYLGAGLGLGGGKEKPLGVVGWTPRETRPHLPIHGVATVICSMLPFLALLLEARLIATGLGTATAFALCGHLAVFLLLLLLACAEVAILFCYPQLCAGDPRWWRAFFTPCCSALPVLLYAAVLRHGAVGASDPASALLQLGSSALACLLLMLLAGSAGVLACLWSLRGFHAAARAGSGP